MRTLLLTIGLLVAPAFAQPAIDPQIVIRELRVENTQLRSALAQAQACLRDAACLQQHYGLLQQLEPAAPTKEPPK